MLPHFYRRTYSRSQQFEINIQPVFVNEFLMIAHLYFPRLPVSMPIEKQTEVPIRDVTAPGAR